MGKNDQKKTKAKNLESKETPCSGTQATTTQGEGKKRVSSPLKKSLQKILPSNNKTETGKKITRRSPESQESEVKTPKTTKKKEPQEKKKQGNKEQIKVLTKGKPKETTKSAAQRPMKQTSLREMLTNSAEKAEKKAKNMLKY